MILLLYISLHCKVNFLQRFFLLFFSSVSIEETWRLNQDKTKHSGILIQLNFSLAWTSFHNKMLFRLYTSHFISCSSLPLNAWMKLNYEIKPKWNCVNSLSLCLPSRERSETTNGSEMIRILIQKAILRLFLLLALQSLVGKLSTKQIIARWKKKRFNTPEISHQTAISSCA